MLSAAFGGRRVFAILWMIWLFVMFALHQVNRIQHGQVSGAYGYLGLALPVMGGLVYFIILFAHLSSAKGRTMIFKRQPELPEISNYFKAFARSLPVLVSLWAFIPYLKG